MMFRCILETPETHGYGVDFCRVPVDCEICSDVSVFKLTVSVIGGFAKAETPWWPLQVREIEELHVSDLSVELFEERYALDDLCYLYLDFCFDHIFPNPDNREI